jgi:arginine decarboxylase
MIELDLAGLVNAACDEDFDPVSPPRRPTRSCPRRDRAIRSPRWPAASPPSCWFRTLPASPCPCPASGSAARTPVIKLILAMEEFGKRFPGFEREVHGIEVDADGNYWMRAVIELVDASTEGSESL